MYKFWIAEEIEILRKYYPIVERKKIITLIPNKSPSAIIHKAVRLGLKKEERWWSQKEIETLKNCYSHFTRAEILKVLPLKDWVNIRHKASELGLKLEPVIKYKRNWKKFDAIVLSDVERGYIAGILDGEGMIRICRCTNTSKKGGIYYSPMISMVNTSGALMGKIRDLLQVGCFYRQDRVDLNHKAVYVYTIGSIGGCKMIIDRIGDLLIVKKPHEELLREFLAIKETKEKGTLLYRETQLYELMKRLNHRGV